MRQIALCFCCKRNEIDLNKNNFTANTEPKSNGTYISESPKLSQSSQIEIRPRTTSTSSMKSIRSFYSTRSRSSVGDDYYSICSADSFQSVATNATTHHSSLKRKDAAETKF